MTASWVEDFSGEPGSPPDPRTWRHETGGGGWDLHQLQHYTDRLHNAAVSDRGQLRITARQELDGRVTSARLVTKGRLLVRFGTVAARIRMPSGSGMWAAFWMLGADIDEVAWPACGEIDVVEWVASDPTAVHGTIHGTGFAGLEDGIGHRHETGVDLAEDFHVYGVDWSEERIVWTFDGQPYIARTPADTPDRRWPFRRKCFLLLNLAVGGDWPGNTTKTPALPATMIVDWIRADGGTVERPSD